MLSLRNPRTMISKLCNLAGYIPIALVAAIYVAEKDLEHHTFKICLQFFITFVVLVVFFIISYKFKNGKIIGLSVASIIWLVLILLKNKYASIRE